MRLVQQAPSHLGDSPDTNACSCSCADTYTASGDLANMQVTLIITQPNHRRLLRTPSSINFLLDLLFTFLTFDIVCWSIRRCHHLITVQYPESGTISESTTGSNRKVSRDVPDNRSCRQ